MLATMPDLPLHDHGWLALPLELRQRLGLRTGDRLQIEMIDGGVRLRPAGQAARVEVAPAPAPAMEDRLTAKPGRGRPRKQVPAEPQAELPLQAMEVQPEEPKAAPTATGKRSTRGLLPDLKVGGRRKSKPAGSA
jgi:bifunctional DNA-binding transcriptional regulator/antitoxin component of YhaV-PrlF toxin-antitoxin module